VVFVGLSIQGALSAAEVTYRQGLRAALAKDNWRACDTITEGFGIGDTVLLAEAVRPYCKIEFAAIKKNPRLCLTIPAGRFAADDKTICFEKLARTLRRPELCESVTEEYRDSCRAQAITETSQCSEGFRGKTWRINMKDPETCIQQIAENQRDEKLCHSLASPDDQHRCLRRVADLREEDSLFAPNSRSEK
jgi:hypothetical protein